MSDQIKKQASPLERLKTLDALVTQAIQLTRVAVEGGEFHLNPVYTGLRNAETAIKTRIFQIDDSEREAENAKKTALLEAERKAANDKSAAETQAAADAAVKKQRDEEAAEKERLRILEVQRTGTTRQRYMLKNDNEIKAIIAGLKIEAPKGANKGQLVNLIMQKECYQVTEAEQDAAAKGQ